MSTGAGGPVARRRRPGVWPPAARRRIATAMPRGASRIPHVSPSGRTFGVRGVDTMRDSMARKTSARARAAQPALFDAPTVAAAPVRKRPRRPAGPGREDATTMAARQREISISEFFTKNRHLLGFDNPQKALLTAIKEAVDNSLDACEEAGILPELIVEIHEVGEERFRIVVEDNGPGIVRQQIPKI